VLVNFARNSLHKFKPTFDLLRISCEFVVQWSTYILLHRTHHFFHVISVTGSQWTCPPTDASGRLLAQEAQLPQRDSASAIELRTEWSKK